MKWNNPALIPPSGGGYLKLKQGENKVRIVSGAEVYGRHFINKKPVICAGKETCEFCLEGDKSRPVWVLWVIDRADNQIKVFEAGYQIIKQIQNLAKGAEYGFGEIPSYDIFIQKEGEELQTEYTVTPARKDTDLTEKELKEISGLKPPAEIIEEKKVKEPF